MYLITRAVTSKKAQQPQQERERAKVVEQRQQTTVTSELQQPRQQLIREQVCKMESGTCTELTQSAAGGTAVTRERARDERNDGRERTAADSVKAADPTTSGPVNEITRCLIILLVQARERRPSVPEITREREELQTVNNYCASYGTLGLTSL